MALSAVGDMTMERLKQSFPSLSGCRFSNKDRFNIDRIRNLTLRALSSLGHCESDFDNRYVTVCPPLLVELPRAGSPRAVLTGARTEAMAQKIKKFYKANQQEFSVYPFPQRLDLGQSEGDDTAVCPLPFAVIFEATSQQILSQLSEALKIEYLPYSPVPCITTFSASLNDVFESLDFKTRERPPNWIPMTFDPDALKRKDDEGPGVGSYLSSYTQPRTQQQLHLYWRDGESAEIDRDWGRWLSLAQNQKKALLYDDHRLALAVPAHVPLPGLLARAAALCSGRAPLSTKTRKRSADVPAGHRIEVYRAVPPYIAEVIASKLDQRLENCRLELD